MPCRLKHFLKHFPPVNHAFAYGSGVMHQPGLYPGHDEQPQATTSGRGLNSSPMVDLIFAVENALTWHAKNIELNKDHYSWLTRSRYGGSEVVCAIADHVGVGVHFNTLVPIDGQMVKYGVIEMRPLTTDLVSWSRLYISGRMHKPTTVLKGSPEVIEAQEQNIRSALKTALLLLPGAFSTENLLKSICGLSYWGDVRMGFAEDPHKVSRIVAGSQRGLEGMYWPLMTTEAIGKDDLGAMSTLVTQVSEGHWQQDVSSNARRRLLRCLPAGVLHEMSRRLGLSLPESHLQMSDTREEVLDRVVSMGKPAELVAQSLRAIVWRSSISQALAGALASGGGKAFEYVARKVRKAAWSRAPPSRN